MRRKSILLFVALLLALNVFCWQEVFVLAGPEYLKVDFLNVGQGDAAFIKTPQGHQIIIDGGPAADIFLEKVSERMPFWDRTIDVVILTHPEKDHMTGLMALLERYKVDYFIWTGVFKDDAENKKLAEILEKVKNRQDFLSALPGGFKTQVLAVSSQNKIKAGSALLDILYPFKNLSGTEFAKSSNDTSVVARLIFGESSFLFAGDISSSAEKDLASSVKGEQLKSNVLKVAHHGSKYSTSDVFLENVKPEVAIIPVGKNSYGHPTPEVLQRLEKYDIKTLRTDQLGDVELLSDGKNIQIKSLSN